MSTQYENLSFFPPGTKASTQSTLDGFTVHPVSRPKVVSLISLFPPNTKNQLLLSLRAAGIAQNARKKKKTASLLA